MDEILKQVAELADALLTVKLRMAEEVKEVVDKANGENEYDVAHAACERYQHLEFALCELETVIEG